jgi:UDP-N-acetylmuramoyl-L-alanyl-D-glutamate--2,6-diaminopimelate ligase
MVDRLLGALVSDAALPTVVLRGDAATPIAGITHDSRKVADGFLFCCLPGTNADGHDFAAAAVTAGASALLVERELDLEIVQLVVPNARAAMGLLASAFWAHPSRSLTVVGVTGTNGKTTTVNLIASVLEHAGVPTGMVGTLTGKHTTPESPDLQETLAGFVADGKRAVVMEVSSHGLELHRADGCHFDVAVFTNLGRDHLDLHGTMERYFAAKAMLFEAGRSEVGVANVDDPHGRLLVDADPIPMISFSRHDMSDLQVGPTSHSYLWRGQRVQVGIGGAFNAMNSLAAATACAALGLNPAVVAEGLSAAGTVPGRFEPVRAGQPFDVIIDFAHTPDGLREALKAARSAAGSGRVTVVFGCGGDRDTEKRPEMGHVAAELADRVVVTSDNPRSEDPISIINAIIAGVPADYRAHVVSEPDRRQAFALAFQGATAGDVVVIAGKGHETTQTIGGDAVPFDDRAVARELLEVAQ